MKEVGTSVHESTRLLDNPAPLDAKAAIVFDVAEDAYGRLKRTIVNPQKIVRWNGRYYPIEATCVRGGVRAANSARHAPSSFEEAMKIGSKELTDSMNSGQIVIVDVQEWWTRGVSGPELEPLPANILSEWGISVEGVAGAPRPVGGQPQIPGQPTVQAPASADAFIGVWRDYDIVKTYIGEVANNSMNMVCQQMLITDVATGTSQQGYPDGRVTAQLKDGKLVGTSASDQGGGTIEFSFERKRIDVQR